MKLILIFLGQVTSAFNELGDFSMHVFKEKQRNTWIYYNNYFLVLFYLK